ncbi:hypothetical protein MN608_02802 [Microdochium nivale]|nr:hypothetical protein MN608_02802 [Microdochium nivale]
MAPPAWRDVTDQDARSAGPPPDPRYWGFNHYHDAEPPLGFFKTVPAGARAVFSTENGKRPLRPLPTLDNQRRNCYAWPAEQIAWLCNHIRTEFPSESKYLQPVISYCDLFNYWDAYDIYHYGAQNLNNVINRIRDENLTYLPALAQDSRPEFEQWIDNLLHTDQQFSSRLMGWSEQNSPDIISTLGSKHNAEYKDLEDFYLTVLRGVLWERFQALRDRSPTLAPANVGAKALSYGNGNGCSSAAQVEPQIHTPCGDLVVDGTSTTAARSRREGEWHAKNNDWPTSGLVQRLALPSIAPHHVQLGLTPAAAALLPFAFKIFPPPAEGGGYQYAMNPTMALPMPAAPYNAPYRMAAQPRGSFTHHRQNSGYGGDRVHPANKTWQGHGGARSATTPHFSSYHAPPQKTQHGVHHTRSTPPRQPQGITTPMDARYPSGIIPPYPRQVIQSTMTSSSVVTRPLPHPPVASHGRNLSSNRDNMRNFHSAEGKWQAIGKDDLHGVKQTFRKNQSGWSFSERSQMQARSGSGSGAAQTPTRGPAHPGSRGFSGQHALDVAVHSGNVQDDVFGQDSVTVAAKRSTPNPSRTFNMLGRTVYPACVNLEKYKKVDGRQRFEPCECPRCRACSRTIYVGFTLASYGLRPHPGYMPIFEQDAEEKLRAIFSRFGQIENINIWPMKISAEIRFAAEEPIHIAIRELHNKLQPAFNWHLRVTHSHTSPHHVPLKTSVLWGNDSPKKTDGIPGDGDVDAQNPPTKIPASSPKAPVPCSEANNLQPNSSHSRNSSGTLAGAKASPIQAAEGVSAAVHGKPADAVDVTQADTTGHKEAPEAAVSEQRSFSSPTGSIGKPDAAAMPAQKSQSGMPGVSNHQRVNSKTFCNSISSSTTTTGKNGPNPESAKKKGKKTQATLKPNASFQARQATSPGNKSA